MRDASVSNIAGGRMIESEAEEETGIEVEEQRFDSMEELLAHVKRVMGELE